MRGKIAIVVMLGLAIAAAGFAWWQNYQRSVRARAFWRESAATIRFAKKVQAFGVNSGGEPFEPVDISTAPGLLNARTALMSDDAFDWSAEPGGVEPQWKYCVRFVAGEETVTLLFSEDSDSMLFAERDEAIVLDAKTAAGWRSYLARTLGQQQPADKNPL
jgi:hypothetical protein